MNKILSHNMVKGAVAFGLCLGLTACGETSGSVAGTSPSTPASISKKAVRALPEGVGASSLYKSPNGCYSVSRRGSDGAYLEPLIDPLSGVLVCD
ncbi:hypothetical protein [Nereida sp.]|uniref:hypothetical protein n=1 Tax=Nereida sp. TaxID=2736090 RepID=UPI003F6A3994